jgi:hypothetical protein
MSPITSAALPDPHPHGYMYRTNVDAMTSTALPADQQAARPCRDARAARLSGPEPVVGGRCRSRHRDGAGCSRLRRGPRGWPSARRSDSAAASRERNADQSRRSCEARLRPRPGLPRAPAGSRRRHPRLPGLHGPRPAAAPDHGRADQPALQPVGRVARHHIGKRLAGTVNPKGTATDADAG